ncbi:hypothetical protein P5V15_012073 [Pogonomyrmex californicus]
MSEQEDIAIAIIRMEKLLSSITNKIEKSIEKCGTRDSSLLREIINLINFLKKSVVSRMKRTPEAECAYVINLQDCRAKVAETLAELEALQEISAEQTSNFEIFLKDIVTCINDEEEIMHSIKETSEIEISKEMKESMQEMLIVREREEAQKKLLQSEVDSADCRLHGIIEFNATNEMKLFDMCAKVEQEYTTVLAKYDCDIGAFHALMEKLSEDHEAIKAEIRNMEDQLTVQRTLYVRYKKEREIALMKAFTEKLEFFRYNRAAKIIQRAWRAYFERISLKKRRKMRRK